MKQLNSSKSKKEKELEQQLKQISDTLYENPLDNSIGSALSKLRDQNLLGREQGLGLHQQSKIARQREGGVMDGELFGETAGLYTDEFGRTNTKKQQFRQISWAFHGQGQHAGNAEKRRQNLEREHRIQGMDLSAPPTLKALVKEQERTGKAHMSLG